MGVTKTEIFSEQQNRLASYAKVLGHPARIAILMYLFEKDDCVCNDLVEEIGLAQATISQHLKELKHLNLIKGNIEGTKICYCINENEWNVMKTLLFTFLSNETQNSSCC